MNWLKTLWNLRGKTVLIIALALTAMVGVLYLATGRILFTSFAKVEKTSTERNVNRVTDAIRDEIEALSSYTSAYSIWDDTQSFVERGRRRSFAQNAADPYVASNITPATFESEGHNLFAFVDGQHKLVWDAGYSLVTSKTRPVSDSLRRYFTGNSPLISFKGASDIKNGFVMVKEGLMYISVQPLVDSNGELPITGTVATGRDFGKDQIEGVEQKTHLGLAVYPLTDTNQPADVAEAKQALAGSGGIYVRSADSKTVYGYTILNDIQDQPLLLVRVATPREVFQQGVTARNYFTLSLIGIGIIFFIMTVFLLARLYRRDEEVQELKDRFIAIASHELRTPLTAIKGGSDLLEAKDLSDDARSSLSLIQHGTSRLNQLIDELLNVATIEKGELKANPEPVDVGQLVLKLCHDLEGIASHKGLTLESHIADNLPKALADIRLLRSSVLGLLDNAIKFTDHGHVSVTVDTKDQELAIAIADTGPGINPETSYLLFKKFSKLASAQEAFREGHGLGLYLTKLSVEANGGRIDVQSSPGGSVFTIFLPIKSA